jgi:hypothetical protein
MRDNIEWRLAEIYAVREAKFSNETVNDDEETEAILYDDLLVSEHPHHNTNREN